MASKLNFTSESPTGHVNTDHYFWFGSWHLWVGHIPLHQRGMLPWGRHTSCWAPSAKACIASLPHSLALNTSDQAFLQGCVQHTFQSEHFFQVCRWPQLCYCLWCWWPIRPLELTREVFVLVMIFVLRSLCIWNNTSGPSDCRGSYIFTATPVARQPCPSLYAVRCRWL